MRIGKSDVEAPKMMLGTFAMGGGTSWQDTTDDDGELIAFMKEAREAGVRAVDTAPVYGTGRSERLLAEVIKDNREELYVASKCSLQWRTKDGTFEYARDGHEVYRCYDKASLIQDCEDALRRLQTDYLDCLIIHRTPKINEFGETMEAMEELRHRGIIRSVGLSNILHAENPEEAVETCLKYGQLDLIQEKANLLMHREVERVRTICEQHEITFQTHSPLESGALVGKINPDMYAWKGDVRSGRKWFLPENIPVLNGLMDDLQPIAERHGVSIPVLCIAWLNAQSPLMNLLVGARRMTTLTDTMRALSVTLTAEEVTQMNALADTVTERAVEPDRAKSVSVL